MFLEYTLSLLRVASCEGSLAAKTTSRSLSILSILRQFPPNGKVDPRTVLGGVALDIENHFAQAS